MTADIIKLVSLVLLFYNPMNLRSVSINLHSMSSNGLIVSTWYSYFMHTCRTASLLFHWIHRFMISSALISKTNPLRLIPLSQSQLVPVMCPQKFPFPSLFQSSLNVSDNPHFIFPLVYFPQGSASILWGNCSLGLINEILVSCQLGSAHVSLPSPNNGCESLNYFEFCVPIIPFILKPYNLLTQ